MKRIVKIFILILIGGGVIGAFILLNSKPDKISEKEKEKALGQILGRKANLNPDIKTGNIVYKGKYLTFSYPAKAKIYTYIDEGSKKDTSILESFSFDIDNPRLTFNLSVTENQVRLKDAADIPGARYRLDKSNGYTKSQVNIEGDKGLVFSKDGSSDVKTEKTAFFLRADKIYSIAITGNNTQDVSELFNTFIKYLVFLN